MTGEKIMSLFLIHFGSINHCPKAINIIEVPLLLAQNSNNDDQKNGRCQ